MLHPYSGECIVGLLAEAGKSFLTPLMPRIKYSWPIKLVKRKKILTLVFYQWRNGQNSILRLELFWKLIDIFLVILS